MGTFCDLTGQRFGRLVVMRRAQNVARESGRSLVMWECLCDCGNTAYVTPDNLKRGAQVSCGCYSKERNSALRTTHGLSNTRLYGIWLAMRRRCHLATDSAYHEYGARGIVVCDDWNRSFEAFKSWAMTHGYSDNLSIDRIDNNGNYTPDNCRWVDCVAQANNRRSNRILTHNGESHTVTEWARILGKNPKTLFTRLYSGDSVEQILRT